jgi:hypothetical protein
VDAAVDFVADPAWPGELDTEVVQTLDRLIEALDWLETQVGEDGDELSVIYPDPPSGEPFCGCETCVRREILTIAVTRTVEAVASRRIKIVDA